MNAWPEPTDPGDAGDAQDSRKAGRSAGLGHLGPQQTGSPRHRPRFATRGQQAPCRRDDDVGQHRKPEAKWLPAGGGRRRWGVQWPMDGKSLPGRFFLKLDVQGYELEVLRGAERTLTATDVVLMEVSLLQYNAGAPLFAEVTAFMKAIGFVVYDICGQLRRAADEALFQADLLFVREDSTLRASKQFWSHEPAPLNRPALTRA